MVKQRKPQGGRRKHRGGDEALRLITAGLAHHNAGRLDEAEADYRRALDRVPQHVDALHLLGVLRHQAGDAAAAVGLIRQAIDSGGNRAEFFNHLGIALLVLGRAEEAAEALRKAISLKDAPFAEALINLGNALRAAGRPQEAASAYADACKAKPELLEGHYNLAIALADLGQIPAAVDALLQLLRRKPDHGDALRFAAKLLQDAGEVETAVDLYRAALAWNGEDPGLFASVGFFLYKLRRYEDAAVILTDALRRGVRSASMLDVLGSALQGLGRLSEAEACFRDASSLDPSSPRILNNLGNVLQMSERMDAAIACYRRALTLDPNSAETRSNLGNAYRIQDRLDEAEESLRAAVAIRPNFPPALNNLGFVLQVRGRLEEAAAAYEAAVQASPDYAEAIGNLGLVRMQQRRFDEAGDLFQRAIELDPSLALVRFNAGLMHLQNGDLEAGWQGYQWRFQAGRAKPGRRPGTRMWRGEPLNGRRLMVWREQGVGDEILFASHYPGLAIIDGPCVVECDPRLLSLFGRSFPHLSFRGETMRPDGRETLPAPDFDVHVPAGTLPWLMTREAGVMARPWLQADPARVAVWAEALAALGSGLKVGVCWRSSLLTTERSHSYASLESWAALLRVPGVMPVCLQYDDCTADLEELDRLFNVSMVRFADLDLKDDFEGVAALMMNLDLVITAPTSVGELAGALGVPVWRICPSADWTFLGTRLRPWYPSMMPCLPGPSETMAGRLRRAATRLRYLADLPRPVRPPEAAETPVFNWGVIQGFV